MQTPLLWTRLPHPSWLQRLHFTITPCLMQIPPYWTRLSHLSWLQRLCFTIAPCLYGLRPVVRLACRTRRGFSICVCVHSSHCHFTIMCFFLPSCLTPRTHLAWWPRCACQTAKLLTVMTIAVKTSSQLVRFSLATRYDPFKWLSVKGDRVSWQGAKQHVSC